MNVSASSIINVGLVPSVILYSTEGDKLLVSIAFLQSASNISNKVLFPQRRSGLMTASLGNIRKQSIEYELITHKTVAVRSASVMMQCLVSRASASSAIWEISVGWAQGIRVFMLFICLAFHELKWGAFSSPGSDTWYQFKEHDLSCSAILRACSGLLSFEDFLYRQ